MFCLCAVVSGIRGQKLRSECQEKEFQDLPRSTDTISGSRGRSQVNDSDRTTEGGCQSFVALSLHVMQSFKLALKVS
jgi:hypothetical protein